MNRKAVITIFILIFVMLVSLAYAFVQQTAAKRAWRYVEELKMQHDVARIEAENQRKLADKVAAQYQTALRDLELAKQKCK